MQRCGLQSVLSWGTRAPLCIHWSAVLSPGAVYSSFDCPSVTMTSSAPTLLSIERSGFCCNRSCGIHQTCKTCTSGLRRPKPVGILWPTAVQCFTAKGRELTQSLPGLQDRWPMHSPGIGHAVPRKLYLLPWPTSLLLSHLQGLHQ